MTTQMDLNPLRQRFLNAHKAGDVEAAKLFKSKMQEMLAAQPSKQEEESTWGEYLGGVGNSLAQGVTLGFADELKGYAGASLGSLTGAEGSFEDRRRAITERNREAVKEFAEENPWTDFALQAVGGLALPGGVVGRAGMMAGKAGAGAAKRALAGAADGAIVGSVAGFGMGEGGASDRLGGAATGAIFGGAGGAAAGKIADTISDGVGFVKARLNPQATGETKAVNAFAKIARDKGMSGEQLRSQVQQLGPEGSMFDVLGRQGVRLGKAARAKSIDADDTLEDFFAGRSAEANERLQSSLMKAAGLDEALDTSEFSRMAQDQQRPKIRSLYEEAAGADFGYQDLAQLQKGLVGDSGFDAASAKALDAAERWAAREGRGVSAFDVGDLTKRELDAMAQPALGQRVLNNEQSLSADASRRLRDNMDQMLTAYPQARAAHQDLLRTEEGIKQAAKLGEGKASNSSLRQLANAEEIDPLVSQSYASSLVNKLAGMDNGETIPSQFVKKMGNNRNSALRQQILGSRANQVDDQIARELKFQKTSNQIRGGSQTNSNQMDRGILSRMAGNAFSPIGLAADLTGAAFAAPLRALGANIDEAMAEAVARIGSGQELPQGAIEAIQSDPVLRRYIASALGLQGGSLANEL